MKKTYLVWGIVLSGILGDQISKYLAQEILEEKIVKIFSFFSLHLTKNEGIAFSIPFSGILLILVICLLLTALYWWGIRKEQRVLSLVGLSFVFSGGVGNMIDRIMLGSVVDFLSFWSFPIFNIADTLITSGIFLYIIGEVIRKKESTFSGSSKA